MFTAKIMYCLWVTLAEKDDNFVIETTKPLPKKYKNMSRKEQMKFIRKSILGRSNEKLTQVSACVKPKINIKTIYQEGIHQRFKQAKKWTKTLY